MINEDDRRLQQIHDWLTQTLGSTDFSLDPASADASFRRYFRICQNGQSYIVMDAPPEQEDCRPFIAVAALFRQQGLNTPRVLAQDLAGGLLLLDDLGERLYLSELNDETAEALYGDAMQALLCLQSAPNDVVQAAKLPAYDRRLLLDEMTLFLDWYLQRHLGLSLNRHDRAILDTLFSFLADAALSQPQVMVHRDYHSRNLLVCESSPDTYSASNPGILDFQDAVIGPSSYDLVSLLRDCYIAWPRERVQAWVAQYFELAQARGILPVAMTQAQFMSGFDLMGIQRHLKASGIFARLNYRDHKPGYLDDIPRTLAYIRSVGAALPELEDFLGLLDRWHTNTAVAE